MKHADVKNDSTANLMKYMILADNYLAIGEPGKAKAALDTCLDVNQNYWLGRNNRANLRMQDGDYFGAIEDLTVALKKQPEDADMLATRGWAFKQSQQLYAAKQDFEKAAKLNPKNERELKKEIEKTEIEIKRLERIVEPTKVNIDRTQLTKQQYITAASASNSLGDIATTKKLVTKGLEIDNSNPKLIAIQIDNLLKQNDVAKAKEVLSAALKRNVKKEEIAKNSSNVAKLIREMVSKNELEIQ
jgi:tetratricopeptide (TPR) repeat protein